MWSNLGLLLLSTLITLGAFELGVRVRLVPQPEFVVSDAWWQDNWYRRRRGPNPREFVKLDPDLGWVVAPNLDRLEYQGAHISTNSASMRGRREYSVERTDAARIVAVGDSYTFGQCAQDDQTFPAVMEEVLPRTEVLNLGVMGYGQDQALLRLRRDGFRYRPDVAVFGFHSSDMRRNLLSFRDYGKPRFRMTAAGLVLENVPVPTPAEYDRKIWPPRLWNYPLMFRDAVRYRDPETHQKIHELAAAIVHRMAREAEEAGVRLVLVHLPHPSALRGEEPFGWPWLANLCDGEKEADFLCADPVPRFRELLPTQQDVRAHFRCHYSPLLYRAVGEVVADGLRREFPELFR